MTPIQVAQADEQFQMHLAKICGVRHQAREEGYIVIGYHWRGKIYITDFYKAPENL